MKSARWSIFIMIVVFVLLAFSTVEAADTKAMGDLTGPWQLLVDDYLIEEKTGVVRKYHPFEKYAGNPVLVADKEWEGNLAYVYGTVLPEESGPGYRMWYHVWDGQYRNLYATSKDGVNWLKPQLQLVEYKGSKANNILFRRTSKDHLPQVIHTSWEKDPNRRYKMFNYDYGRTPPDNMVSGFYAAYSPDGIHWTDAANNPVLKDPGDVGNFVWDEHTKRYLVYPKTFAPVRGFRRRCIGFAASEHFDGLWPSAQLILTPDEVDDRWVQSGDQHTDFYGLSGFAYESGYLGLLWMFPITDGKNDGPVFCELVSSRDGINWIRQEVQNGRRLPILDTGANGSWDDGMIYTTNHPLIEGDTIKLWYGGFTVTHSSPEKNGRAGIGLATLRKDGFASLDTGEQTGVVTTKTLKNLRGQLHINADARGGFLKVEVLDKNGKVLPGYSKNDCEPINSNGVDLLVTWKTKNQLPRIKFQRLRFVMQNTSLYSFMAGQGVDVAEPESPMNIELTFEGLGTKGSQADYITERHKFTGQNDGEYFSYLVQRPTGKSSDGKYSLLIFLYGAGGSIEEYNLQRKPFDELRRNLSSRGYFILIPELGPVHWMNDASRHKLDKMISKVLAEYPIDVGRIHLMGSSMGGGSALAYAVHRPELIASTCSHLGMTDFTQWYHETLQYRKLLEKAYGGTPETRPAVYRKVSAMANLATFAKIPVFLVYGEKDTLVKPQHGRQLVQALTDKGYYAVYRQAKNQGHTDEVVQGFGKEIADFFDSAVGILRRFELHNNVSVVQNKTDAAAGSGAVAFTGKGDTHDTLEILGTLHMGNKFTLAAMVKTPNKKLTRLFSTYRGSGENVTGELLMDFDPTGKAIKGLRFIVNGQTVESGPLKFDDGEYHHLAVTYDYGKVKLYLDGKQVGQDKIMFGSSHLQHDKKIIKLFNQPEMMGEVGIHLGDNLHVGEDVSGRFVTYQDETFGKPSEQLVGFIDNVVVIGRALNGADVKRLMND